jgi:hypothetical protein
VTWRHFLGASVLAAVILLFVGAPFPSVAVGIALAAFLNWRASTRSR